MLLIDPAAALSRWACWSAPSTRSTAVNAVSFDLTIASEISRTDALSSSAPAATDSIMLRTRFALHARDHLGGGVGGIFHDLVRLAVEVADRIVGGLDPDLAAALAEAAGTRADWIFAAVEARPEFAVVGTVAFGGIGTNML